MVNFAELLRKSIERQALEPTLQVRQRVYEEARSKIKSRLAEMGAPELVRRSYLLQLEGAICEVEASYVMAPEFFDHKNDSANARFSYNARLPDYLGGDSDSGSTVKKFHVFSEKPARLMEEQSKVEQRQAFPFEEENKVFALDNGRRRRSRVRSGEPFDLDIADLLFNDDKARQPDGNNQINRAKPVHSGFDFDDGYTNPLIERRGEALDGISNNIVHEPVKTEFVNRTDFVDQNDREKKRVNEIRSEIVPLDILRQERKNRIKRMAAESVFVGDVKNRTRAENSQSIKPQAVFVGSGKTELEATSINTRQSEASWPKQNSFVPASTDAQHMTVVREKDMSEKDTVGKDMTARNSESLNEVAGIFGYVGAERGLSRASGIDDYPLYIDTPVSPVSAGILSGKIAFDTIGGQTARMEKQPFGIFNREALNNKTDNKTGDREHDKIAGIKTETVVMASTTPFSKNGLKRRSFSGTRNGQTGANGFEAVGIPDKASSTDMPVYEGNKVGVNGVILAENAVHKVSTAQAFGCDERGETQKADISRKSQTDFLSEKTFPDGTPTPVDEISTEEKTRNSNFSFPSGQQNEQRKGESVAEKNTTTSGDSATTFIDEEREVVTASVPDIPEEGGIGQKKECLNGLSDKGSEKAGAGDIADTFEQKRTEFFKRLDHIDNNRLEQDLFPPMSFFDGKDKGKATNRPHPRGYYPSHLLKMLTGRSVAAGVFFILALVFYAYFHGRSGPSVPLGGKQSQNIVTGDEKARNNPDPIQKNVANIKKTNDNAKNPSRKNDNAGGSQRSNTNNPAKKIANEKLPQPQKSSARQVKPDQMQTNLTENSHDALSLTNKNPVVRLASLPASVMRPVVEETSSENVTDDPAAGVKNKSENPTPETQSAHTEKTEPGLLLINDKKGNQLKMQLTVTWSLKPPHSPENPLDETALVANFKTDDGKLGARMSIRKNYRDNLGATHLIDLSFSQADGFDSGVVVNVKGVYYGDKINVLNKQASTIVADLYENNFVASLRDDKDNKENNRNFLTRSAVIGFQTVFTDGKTALFMLNKGAAENQLFDRFNDPTTH